MKRNAVTFDAKSMTLEMEGGDAVGVKVTARRAIMQASFDDPVPIASVPKAACLSVKNVASVAQRIAKFGLEEEREIALAAAITHEMAIGASSKWHDYLRSLPEDGEPVPLLWPEALLDGLEGTDIVGQVREEREACTAAWEGAVYPLLLDALGKKVKLGEKEGLGMYKKAVSYATSRAFYVDSEHLEALVPLADMFNHKVRACVRSDGGVVGKEVLGGTVGKEGLS